MNKLGGESIQMERAQRELAETLREVANILNSNLETDEVLRLILEQLARVVIYDSASVMLLDDDRLQLVAAVRNKDNDQGIATLTVDTLSHVQEVLSCRLPVIIPDTTVDPRWHKLPETEGITCWMGVPLVVHDRVIGLLNINKGEPAFYSQDDASIAMTFANQAAVALENARLYGRLQAHTAELEARVAERTRELTEANQQLQQLDRLKSKFMADVSHELRTPITAMALYIDLLQRGRSEHHERYLAVLQNQVARLGELVEKVLVLSRIDLRRDQIEFESVDLNALLETIITSHRPRAETALLFLNFEPDPSLPPVKGVAGQLIEMVNNLISNAITYTVTGGVLVRTFLSQDKSNVCLEVHDTGIEIETEEIPHLFNRFYRGARVGQLNIPGAGLGLAIVKEIIDLHGGQIEVQSRTGQGTTFRVFLPVQR